MHNNNSVARAREQKCARALSSRIRLYRFLTGHGRIGRAQFWATQLVIAGAFAFFSNAFETAFGRGSTLLLYAPLLWIEYATCAARLHDRDRSAVWLLMLLAPVLGPLWLFFELGFHRGTAGPNRFGSDPRNPAVDYLVVRTDRP